ncbi:MAG TPA: hypothetical protein VH916_12845, partial [Dehalococcoidia bacterium]
SIGPETSSARMVRQVNRDNGGIVYDRAIEAAQQLLQRLKSYAANGSPSAADILRVYEPLDFVAAQAILNTAQRRDPQLLEQRRKEYGQVGRRALRRFIAAGHTYPLRLMAPPEPEAELGLRGSIAARDGA